MLYFNCINVALSLFWGEVERLCLDMLMSHNDIYSHFSALHRTTCQKWSAFRQNCIDLYWAPVSTRLTYFSFSDWEKSLFVRLHECTIFSRITEDLESGYTVRKGEVSRQTSAQCFLDHLLRLWTYLSGGFYKKYRNATVLSKCHWFHVPHFQQVQFSLQMFVKSRNQCSTICS